MKLGREEVVKVFYPALEERTGRLHQRGKEVLTPITITIITVHCTIITFCCSRRGYKCC
jgi:hypothetical protein